MGPARGDSESAAIHDKVLSVLAKAGYEVVLPAGLPSACCGLVFDSRGLPAQGEAQMRALEAALTAASERGRHPILLDTSPCVMRLKDYITDPALKGAIYEPAEFASKHLLPRLSITPQKESVAMHVPCSGKKMKVDKHFEAVMLACAPSVTVSPVPCCGMAGDRGLRFVPPRAASRRLPCASRGPALPLLWPVFRCIVFQKPRLGYLPLICRSPVPRVQVP